MGQDLREKKFGLCETCLYYEMEYRGTAVHPEKGYCKINPPVFLVCAVHDGGELVPQTFTRFPLVEFTDWCGKWASNEGEDEEEK